MKKIITVVLMFGLILYCMGTPVCASAMDGDGQNVNNQDYLVSETFGKYFIGLKAIHFAADEDGNNIVILTMDFSHSKWTKKTYFWNINTEVFQDGIQCKKSDTYSSDNHRDEIKSGRTIEVREAYILRSGSPVEIKMSPLFNLATGEITYIYAESIPQPAAI